MALVNKKRMDQQNWMDLYNSYGPDLLKIALANPSNFNFDRESDEQLLCRLIKWKLNEVDKRSRNFKPNCLSKPDSLMPMPPEVYRRKQDQINRRRLFYKDLHRRDILYLQVINTKDSESFKCLALAKEGNLMQLSDLSIVIHFPKLPAELKLITGELKKFDLIRGALWSCDVWKRRLFVTMDTCIFSENESIPKLGRITRKEFPHYVPIIKEGMTYAGYIQRSSGYKKDIYCREQLTECLGIDTKRIYSLQKGFDNKTYPEPETFAVVRKKIIPDSSTKSLRKSFQYFRSGKLYKAFHYANKAIIFNPDNIQARVTRGTVYANIGKMNKALEDTEDSLKLDPQNESARRQMAELLVAASKTYMEKEQFGKWRQSLLVAKELNPKNREIQELLEKAVVRTYYETSDDPVTLFIHPLPKDVTPIYNRIVPQVDKRRLEKQYKRYCKAMEKKERRRQRAAKRKAEKAALMKNRIVYRSDVLNISELKRSFSSAYLRPSTSTYERPSTSTYERPSTSTYERPSTSTYERPSASTYERPSASAYERPSSSTYERPSSSTYERPSSSTYERPSTSTYLRPSTSTYLRPSTSTYLIPTTSSNRRHVSFRGNTGSPVFRRPFPPRSANQR